MREAIVSRDNAGVKRLAGLLERKKERDESGLFVAEGLRLSLDALHSGVRIRSLYLTEKARERCPETEALEEAAEKTLWIGEELADKISDTAASQGIFLVAEQLDNGESAVKMKSGGHYLLLHEIRDPGNLGTIIRTADALGIDGAFLSGCCELYAPRVIRASMGGMFRLAVSVVPGLKAPIERLRDIAVPVYAAALEGGALVAGHVDFAGGGAVLIGNEARGLPDELIAVCEASLLIPMAKGANSLNAAAAAAILLWEMKRFVDK